MKNKFIFVFIILISHHLVSCGKDSNSSSSSQKAPRYRVLLQESVSSETSGTAAFREEEENSFEAEVHLMSSLRSKKRRIVISSASACPGYDEIGQYEELFDLEEADQMPVLGGQTLIVESSSAVLACGVLVPIPLE